MDKQHEKALSGCLLGTAVGDALGLPLERLTPQRARKLFGEITPDFGMHLFFKRGLVSDDTEHAVLTLQAFLDADGNTDAFRRSLARRLKVWFLALPPGLGAATAKASLKLVVGVSPQKSGLYSAGNGPAMRAPVLGVLIEDKAQLRSYVTESTHLTHTDPKAEFGSLAVAFAAHCAKTGREIASRDFLEDFKTFISADSAQELIDLLERVVASVEKEQPTPEFAVEMGLPYGVSGYIYHTVPVCLHAWLSHQNDFTQAIIAILRCGGDADSTAAIVGGIVGARVGKEGIPLKWRNAVSEWPRSMAWMEALASQAADKRQTKVPFWFFPATLGRNIFLLIVVLLHAFRRILPPY